MQPSGKVVTPGVSVLCLLYGTVRQRRRNYLPEGLVWARLCPLAVWQLITRIMIRSPTTRIALRSSNIRLH